jgi:DNA repair protein RadC
VNESPHSGHHTRLRDKYLRSGAEALHDYELLELLLAMVFARRDTKPIAKALLSRFKSLDGVLNAHPPALLDIPGMGERSAVLIGVVRDIAVKALAQRVQHQDVLGNRSAVEHYLRLQFGSRRDEYVAALFLDSQNHLLESRIMAEGTVNQCAVYPRSIVEQALNYGAAALIIAHNHPGGGQTPSSADWEITRRLIDIGKLMELPLLDHILITRDTTISFRELPQWPT